MKTARPFLVLFFLTCLFCHLHAQEPYLPEPSGQVVTDYEDLLTQSEKEQLAGLIKPSYRSSSNQLMIVCIPTKFTGNLTIEDYANRLFKKWQPGQKDLNNGVMMIVSGSRLDSVGRKVRFEVGYGLEGALPDLLCKKIQMEAMVPLLKEHKYYDAISNGAKAILDAVSAENVGKTPVFRFKVKNEPLLKDGVGLLSTNEFAAISDQLKRVSVKDENEAGLISMNEYLYNGSGNSIMLAERWTGYPLFELQFPNPYKIEQSGDAIHVSRTERPDVYFKAACVIGQSKEETDALVAKLNGLLKEGQYAEAIKASLTFYEEGLAARMRLFHGFMIAQILLSLLIIGMFYYVRSWLKKNRQSLIRKSNPAHGWLTVFSILTGIVVWTGPVSLEMAQMSAWDLMLDGLSSLQLWGWGGTLMVTHIVGIVYLYNIASLKERSKSRSWYSSSSGSYNSNDNSSSYSSSSSSSSSDSSYSSSSSESNSDYGGGGGDSGGGGSSSDW